MSSSHNTRKVAVRDPHRRVIVGVSFEHQVIDYLDGLAQRMGMSRSWVLNTIVYEYARLVEKADITPLLSRFGKQPELPNDPALPSEQTREVIINA